MEICPICGDRADRVVEEEVVEKLMAIGEPDKFWSEYHEKNKEVYIHDPKLKTPIRKPGLLENGFLERLGSINSLSSRRK